MELRTERNGGWLGYESDWESPAALHEDRPRIGVGKLFSSERPRKEDGKTPQGSEFRGPAPLRGQRRDRRQAIPPRSSRQPRSHRLDSPSSLPAGCAPDAASHRRRALSRSKRTPSGSRPSGSSGILYGPAPPGSAATGASGAGYSIFAASCDVEELRMRRPLPRAVDGRGFDPARNSREVWALQIPLGRSPEGAGPRGAGLRGAGPCGSFCFGTSGPLGVP